MFKILGIDKEKCIKCEKCIQSCSVELFSVERTDDMEKKIHFADTYRFCFRCGHCISVCPTEAILYEGADEAFNFKEAKNPSLLLSYEDFMKFTRTRRSTRVFKNQQLSEEEITKILEAMRYSPSASNRQNRHYIVLSKEEDIAFLANKVSHLMVKARRYLKLKYLAVPFTSGLLRKRLLNPKTKVRLDDFFKKKSEGVDQIFFNAPCVIIIHAPSYSRMTASDAGIAITHGMLAAHSMGLGTCWIGFAQEYLSRFKKGRKQIGVPRGHNVYGVFIVGHPEQEFLRAPPRREIYLDWRK
ncbi:MAG: NAD(P)H-quinone oxidoreductase subunit I, chloroplastic [Candidatus Heimdallarchaeota archaeon AB_125]|nr:MAG: NAD(P)H-quinone oxidoreductase subunit I, chloroplastic [Candidatus Heimdallarchaeota archaeon AB_125]